MIRHMEEMTWQEVDALDREKTLVFLSVSPLEQHGPHLPLGMDLLGATYLTRRVAEEFQMHRPDWEVLLTPPLPVGSNAFDFPGSLFTRQRIVRDLLVDFGASLARHGLKTQVYLSMHAGTGHLVAMEEAAEIVSRRFKARVIAPTGAIAARFFTGEYLDELDRILSRPLTAAERESLKCDWHAGWWETSLMLLVRPDLVRQNYAELSPVLVDDYRKINDQLARTVGGGAGYLGAPGQASVDFAEALVRFLVLDCVRLILRLVGGENVASEARSPLYNIPYMRTDFLQNTLAVAAGLLITLVGGASLVDAVQKGTLQLPGLDGLLRGNGQSPAAGAAEPTPEPAPAQDGDESPGGSAPDLSGEAL
jgi:creatinine amidohydrolase